MKAGSQNKVWLPDPIKMVHMRMQTGQMLVNLRGGARVDAHVAEWEVRRGSIVDISNDIFKSRRNRSGI